MLEKDISLLYINGEVIDCSERKFIGADTISAIKYAFWALDKHMWSAMLDCVLKLEDKEQIHEVFKILRSLYDKIDTQGVSYTLNNKRITNEKHYDFAIIKELQKLVNSVNELKKVRDVDWDPIDDQWQKGVGGAQKLLVMHVVYEYCSKEPFEPQPEFTAKPKSSKQFANWSKKENWFCTDSKLGIVFAIIKAGFNMPRGVYGGVQWCAWADLDALTALCEIRTKDFISLKTQIESQIDTHRQTFQL